LLTKHAEAIAPKRVKKAGELRGEIRETGILHLEKGAADRGVVRASGFGKLFSQPCRLKDW
jgi:hypothetical protein